MVHMMSSQQGLCYRRLGKAAVIPDEYVLPFQTNTKPDRVVDNSEIEEIKKMFVSSIDRLQDDYQAGIFHDDTLSPGSYKIYDIEMRDIGDALEVLLYHEGYHTGRIVRLKQLVAWTEHLLTTRYNPNGQNLIKPQ